MDMKITVKGKTFPYAPWDLDVIERASNADAILKEASQSSMGGAPSLEQQTALYNAIDGYFAATLGDGALTMILEGRRDVMDAMEAYYEMRDAVIDAMGERAREVGSKAELPEKYRKIRE